MKNDGKMMKNRGKEMRGRFSPVEKKISQRFSWIFSDFSDFFVIFFCGVFVADSAVKKNTENWDPFCFNSFSPSQLPLKSIISIKLIRNKKKK